MANKPHGRRPPEKTWASWSWGPPLNLRNGNIRRLVLGEESKSIEIGIVGENSIKNILEQLNIQMSENLLDVVLHAVSSPESRNAVIGMLVHDKYCIYYNVWNITLRGLYTKYLPNVEYVEPNYIEITPYTMHCASLIPDDNVREYLIDNISSVIQISKESLLLDIDNRLREINFDLTPLCILPQRLIPSTSLAKATLLTKLMNFPPLYDFYKFYLLYHKTTKAVFEALGDVFSHGASVSEFKSTFCLGSSFFSISQQTFNKIDLNDLKNIDYFENEADKIDHIIKHSNDLIELNKPVICASCGTTHVIQNLPPEATTYIMCLQERTLATKIGLYYFEEFQASQRENLENFFKLFFSTINDVEDPKCLILIEGESENTSLPILGFKARKLLKPAGIKVHNSGSKEQLLLDFKKYKRELPHLKLVVLLDSDAVKEADDIKRMIRGKKANYEMFCIEKGTFEDLFDLNASVQILNKLYPEGEAICISDFDQDKEFLANACKVLYQKKKATFDKVNFAKTMSFSLTKETIPPIITAVIDKALQFASTD